MRIDVLTLFPEIFEGFLEASIPRIAQEKGALEVVLTNIRDFATDTHRSVDERPFGGGPGMVLTPGPVFSAVEHVRELSQPEGLLVLLTPQGERLTQSRAERLSQQERLILLCGRYEGFDERIRLGLRPLELSIGDYVLSGGEVPAMVVIDAVARLLPGVVGDEASLQAESFGPEGLLDHPHYTRPRVFRGMEVPEVLLSGNHQTIAAWRKEQALQRTRGVRRDLLGGQDESQ